MDTVEIREEVLSLLKSDEHRGKITLDDSKLSTLLGEPNYENIHLALVSLKDEGIIFFYHAANGTNHVEMI